MSCMAEEQDELVLIEVKGKELIETSLTRLTMTKPGIYRIWKGK